MKATLDINLEKQENSHDNETQTGRLKVSVADAETNQIIAGASVDVNAKDSDYTDSKETGSVGFATFDGVPVTDLTVSISMNGYQSQTVSVSPSDFQ